MSVDLYVAALDLDRFVAVQGSGREELLQHILSQVSEPLANWDEQLREIPGTESRLPLAQAVAHIVQGEVQRGEPARFEYEVAAALIADALGEPLDAEPLTEARPALLDETDAVIETRLRDAGRPAGEWPTLRQVLRRGPLIDVPLSPRMRLGTGYLTAEEVRRAREAADALDLASDEGLEDLQWPDDALEGAESYRSWLRTAADQGVGLFFHL